MRYFQSTATHQQHQRHNMEKRQPNLMAPNLLNDGMDLTDGDHHNGIGSMANTASAKATKDFTPFDKSAIELHHKQEAMIKSVQATKADKLLNQDQQSFLIGETMEKYQASANGVLENMLSFARTFRDTAESRLFSNDIKIGAYQDAMLKSGVITDKLLSDPFANGKNEALAPLVALFNKADMYGNDAEDIASTLDSRYTPDAVANVELGTQLIQRANGALDGIQTQYEYLAPSPEKMQSYRASKALRDANKKMGM